MRLVIIRFPSQGSTRTSIEGSTGHLLRGKSTGHLLSTTSTEGSTGHLLRGRSTGHLLSTTSTEGSTGHLLRVGVLG